MTLRIPNDDETLKKCLDIDTARDYLVYPKYPELEGIYYDGMQTAMQNKENQAEFDKMQSQWDPIKQRKLNRLLRDGAKAKQNMTLEDMTSDDYPNNILFKNPTELRKLITKLYVQEQNRLNVDQHRIEVLLPNLQGGVTREDIIKVIKKALSGDTKGSTIETDSDYWESLSHLLPEDIDQETLDLIAQENKRLVQEMQDNTRYLLSPRGDLLEITDDNLKQLGFESILFEMDPRNKRDTTVTVKIGKFNFKLLLDEFFTFKQADTKNGLLLPADGEYLKNIILSHLHEIRCSDKLNVAGGNTGQQTGGRSAFHSRRAHRRELPAGQSPTTEQISRSWEHYHVDLIRMNKEALAKGATKEYTFVFEVESIATTGIGPVRSQAPDATKKLNAITA